MVGGWRKLRLSIVFSKLLFSVFDYFDMDVQYMGYSDFEDGR